MIKIIPGNILDATEDIICHQVNCQNVMNSGLAKLIKEKYEVVEEAYRYICDQHTPKQLLGRAQIVKCDDGKYVANIFGQLKYGRDKQYTDYKAFSDGLSSVFTSTTTGGYKGKTIAIPYGIGCGLGGGDWNTVYQLIEAIAELYKQDVTIYHFLSSY